MNTNGTIVAPSSTHSASESLFDKNAIRFIIGSKAVMERVGEQMLTGRGGHRLQAPLGSHSLKFTPEPMTETGPCGLGK